MIIPTVWYCSVDRQCRYRYGYRYRYRTGTGTGTVQYCTWYQVPVIARVTRYRISSFSVSHDSIMLIVPLRVVRADRGLQTVEPIMK